MNNNIFLYTDGGCRGKVGPGAIGFIILDDSHRILHEYSQVIGNTTCNRAEYSALIKGLDFCAKYTRQKVFCYTDSELVVNQLNGIWCLKNDCLREKFHQVKRNEIAFNQVIYQYTPRKHRYIQVAHKILHEAFEGRAVDKNHVECKKIAGDSRG